jgi:hypothetical protein
VSVYEGRRQCYYACKLSNNIEQCFSIDGRPLEKQQWLDFVQANSIMSNDIERYQFRWHHSSQVDTGVNQGAEIANSPQGCDGQPESQNYVSRQHHDDDP